MTDWKSFSGKTVDDAIEEACRFFREDRDKLEIEIFSGGSTGIFGLVGKKKAEIRAKVRGEAHLDLEPSSRDAGANTDKSPRTNEQASSGKKSAKQSGDRDRKGRQGENKRQERPRRPEKQAKAESAEREERQHAKPAKPDSLETKNQPPQAAQQPQEVPQKHEQVTEVPPAVEKADQEDVKIAPQERQPLVLTNELKELIQGVMTTILEAMLEQTPPMEFEAHGDRINVTIDDDENSGLIIGREGQTLSSLQYLVNRIVARKWEEPVRIQVNTGEYREKQDDNLRKMAIYLADKAKTQGRPQSTKPLSSYHRRVVHLALQEDASIQTRSKGDGPLKRVIILPRRGNRQEQQTGK
ncbi:protein jag [Desulfovibrio inopinatus]|uniref:Jag family protein n=1 Tax=Desulfovibrio inopinatus TaxID=102109 RepID=UPI0003F74BA3|nr:protein jag [Desulfovibrio inopinatus]